MTHHPLTLRLGLAGSCLLLIAWLIAPAALASDPSSGGTNPVRSLDEQVQEIKTDVLAIAAELGNLEEKLLYPSDTQLAVFVANAKGETVEIDSARISLDGKLVAHHIYSFKELEALAKGGVQRVHTANVATGSHQLEVAIAGRKGGDKPFEVVERYDFQKDVGPRKIAVRLAGGATSGATVTIEDW